MKKNSNQPSRAHKWVTFCSPRNDSIKVQACSVCGVIKGAASGFCECETSEYERSYERSIVDSNRQYGRQDSIQIPG